MIRKLVNSLDKELIQTGKAIQKLGPKMLIIKKGEHGTVVANYTVAGFSLEGIQSIGMAEIDDRRTEFRIILLVE